MSDEVRSNLMRESIEDLATDYHVQVSLCSGGIVIVYWDWREECAKRSVFQSAENAAAFLLALFKSYEGSEETPEDATVSDITEHK